MKIKLNTKIPGNNVQKVLDGLKKKNGGWYNPHTVAFSGNGERAYCEDLDGNVFLDFASQVASNPLGYNHSRLLEIVKDYSKRFPVKYAGQDFALREHLELIEELLKISPKYNSAFLINSGAEAVENATKIAMLSRTKSKFGVALNKSFHGRTLGALSWTNSNSNYNDGFWRFPNLVLGFDEADVEFEKIIDKYGSEKIGFLILEHVQGEGGYRIPEKKVVQNLRKLATKNGIPYIADEVQAGLARTGKWWAFEHYGIRPDIFTSAKALQVGAVVSSRNMFPERAGKISSTWGGGHILDLALGIETIKIIKKDRLLARNKSNGDYLIKRMSEMTFAENPRGLGLMTAFDVKNSKMKNDLVVECLRNGLIVLGCGERTIRVIPPYIINKNEIDEGLNVIENSLKKVSVKGFKHSGKICRYMTC